MIKESVIKDPALAPEGRLKIDWAAQHSPVLNKLFKNQLADGALDGRKVAMTIHLEAKTAYLALLMHEAGADVTVSGSNPLSTQDDVCAALAERGVRVYATHNPSDAEFERYLEQTIETGPEIMVDDGAELVGRMIDKRPDLLDGVIGASEETTTGILKLKAMDAEEVIPFPVLAANDALCKHMFDNRYGTGHSSLSSLMYNTNLFMGGKTIVVMGFGWVGRGLAKYTKGMGARVIVCEPDPVKLLEAHAEGYEIMNSLDAAEIGDIFVTGTGNLKVLNSEHFERMKTGAILANAGHYDHEIDVAWLEKNGKNEREVRRNVTEYEMPDGRKIHVIVRGRLVNLAGGDGHPVEIMDLTFAVQALAAHHLAKNSASIPAGLQPIPAEIDQLVASTKLDTMGVEPEKFTQEQIDYQKSWR
ncbi:MAG: adenosylhomocysteinase [Rubrobacter sp.]|nr:adenosylhomocysteinase [Rubrobacter sp.]